MIKMLAWNAGKRFPIAYLNLSVLNFGRVMEPGPVNYNHVRCCEMRCGGLFARCCSYHLETGSPGSR